MIDLVITRFKENIEWSNKLIPKLNKRYVYNRGPSKLLSYDDKTIKKEPILKYRHCHHEK